VAEYRIHWRAVVCKAVNIFHLKWRAERISVSQEGLIAVELVC
jgi:hypothetical protein